MRTAEAAAVTGDTGARSSWGTAARRRVRRPARPDPHRRLLKSGFITSARAIPTPHSQSRSSAGPPAGRSSVDRARPRARCAGPGAAGEVPFQRVERIAQEALSTARSVGSATAEIRALGCIGRNAAAVGEADSAFRTLHEALTLARSVGDFTGAAEISIELALALHWAGELDEGLPRGRRGDRRERPLGSRGFRERAASDQGYIGLRSDAGKRPRLDLRRARARPVGSHGVLAHGARALLDLGRGRLDSAADTSRSCC